MRAVAAVVLVLLGWQAVEGALTMIARARADAAVDGRFEDQEHRLRRALGEWWSCYRMLTTHTPPGSLILCDFGDSADDHLLPQRLRHSLYPRFVRGLDLEDPAVQANFVELRRLGSELADVDAALSQAEDAWLTLEERAPL